MLRISPLLDVTPSVCASSFLFSLCLCRVHAFALFLCLCLLFFPFFPFFSPFYLYVPLYIYREIPKKLFLIFLSTNQIMEQFSSVFSSTTLNFMFSRDSLFSLFLFYLFRCFLNSFFLVCDSPLSPNRVPHFLVVTFLYSLFSFSIFLLSHLLLPVAIFNSLSLFCFILFLFI